MDNNNLKLPNVEPGKFVLTQNIHDIIKHIKDPIVDPVPDIVGKLSPETLKALLILNAKAQAEQAALDAKRLELEVQAKLQQSRIFEKKARIFQEGK